MAKCAGSKGLIDKVILAAAALGAVGAGVLWSSARAADDGDNPSTIAAGTPIDGLGPSPLSAPGSEMVDRAHAACFDSDPYPSALKCQKCHEDHFREWSVSQHAYAQLSPVFNTFSNKLIKLTNGTLGDFCIRCHTPVGMSLHEPINISNMDRPPSSREGVTCVVCHRINQAWGKMSARQALVPGDIHHPVYGPFDNEGLKKVLANSDKWGVTKTEADPQRHGRDIHSDARRFFQIVTPGFCGSCHDVFGPDGFRLEDAFSEFKTSPARAQKETGLPRLPHERGSRGGLRLLDPAGGAHRQCPHPAAQTYQPLDRRARLLRRSPRHFPAPPLRHPRRKPETRGTWRWPGECGEWLTFDVDSGWGKEAWESQDRDRNLFPEGWRDRTKRLKGREIIDYNQHLLAEARDARVRLLMHGLSLSDISVDRANAKGIRFSVTVANATDGHGVPTGFDAERVIFLRVVVCDCDGKLVYQSGDLDPNGDLRDDRSAYVHNGELPPDRALFSLQSLFVTRNIRGGERIQGIPVPYSPDPLPFMRPLNYPFSPYGRPILDRKQKQNLEVGGHRRPPMKCRPRSLQGAAL